MRTPRLVLAILAISLFLLPAVFLRSVPATAGELPLWTSVQLLRADQWIGSAVIIRMQPSLVTAAACNVSMATAKHVAAAEIQTPDNGLSDKFGPNVATHVVQAPGLRWGDIHAAAAFFHPTQDLAVVVFVVPQPCGDLRYAVAVIDTNTVLAPQDLVLHIGFPAGWLTIASGEYVGTYQLDLEALHVITSVGGPGSSGGAIFRNGKLVGILVRGEPVPPFRNLYSPLIYLADIWPA